MFGRRTSSTADWTGPDRVIVHAGFRKTGTTTVQDFLALNAAHLPQGLAVSPRDALTQGFRKAVAAHIDAPQPRGLAREAQALRMAVQKIGEETLLISDENLFGQHMATSDGRDIFDLAAEFLPMIEQALSGAAVEFVLYTREQERWLRSAWAQGVKRSGIARSFDDWQSGLPRLDPARGIARIRAALAAPLHVFAMEDDLSGPDPLMGRALFHVAGLDDATLETFDRPGRSNESLPGSALQFLLKLNALGLDAADRRRVARLVEDNPELFAA